MLTAEDICIRDPFILPVPSERAYYLYGTVGTNGEGKWCFKTYRTTDLLHFEEPVEVFCAHDGFWADRDFWAPEVHFYHGKYYMFASFKAEGKCRGTQILTSDKPDGRFVPLTPEPVTPRDWECLDGTLYVSPEGVPYIVFCHEWLQVQDGTVCAMKLTEDLTSSVGEPILLFHGSDPKWIAKGKPTYVTDGPFVFHMPDKTLCMLWSTFRDGSGYVQTVAVSESGNIAGPWKQGNPVFSSDGGHGMLFNTFGGQWTLTLHSPNCYPEHPHFYPVRADNGVLMIETTNS